MPSSRSSIASKASIQFFKAIDLSMKPPYTKTSITRVPMGSNEELFADRRRISSFRQILSDSNSEREAREC
jgi:hypothetical protein